MPDLPDLPEIAGTTDIAEPADAPGTIDVTVAAGTAALRTPSRSRRRRLRRRWVPAAAVVVLTGAASAVASQVGPAAVPAAQLPPVQVANAVISTAQSTVWYCAGAGLAGTAQTTATLLVVNPGRRALHATLTVVAPHGGPAHKAVLLPAGAETAESPMSVVHGQWLASRLVVRGGGVTVSERLTGTGGWALAPCTSETSADWYFADGSTVTGDSLELSVYNPTTSLAIADLTFYAGTTAMKPIPYQGMVIPPGQLVTADVGTYVQNRADISAVVSTRSGTVVANEVQMVGSGGVSGLSLRPGAPVAADSWDVPRSVDSGGGATNIAVFNPGNSPAHVRVRVVLSSGTVVPFAETVAARSTWILTTSQQIHIPLGQPWSAGVTSSGGTGVVVERLEQGASSAPAPQWGLAAALPSAAVALDNGWIVPAPVASGEQATGSIGTFSVVLADPGSDALRVRLYAVEPSGLRSLGAGPNTTTVLKPGATADVTVQALYPVEVVSDGPVAVTGDASTLEAPNVLAVPGFPLS